MTITIKEFSTEERKEYEEIKYKEFMRYYLFTEMPVKDILEKMDINNRNYLAKYIRTRLKREGYNTSERIGKIRQHKWVNNNGR